MKITLEMLDQVRNRTGVSYDKVKKALEKSGGNVVDAIIAIEEKENSRQTLVKKVNQAIRKGNITKLRIRKGDEELLTISLTAGAALGAVGLIAAPGAVVAAAVTGVVAKNNFDCKFELIREDGTVV